MNLPEVVATPSAERIGTQVRLRWTTSAASTDGLTLSGPLTAEICRRVLAGGSLAAPKATACTPIRRVPTQPGAGEAWDTLPPSLLSEAPALLGYRVTLLNRRERAAGPSEIAFAAAGAPPPPVTALTVQSAAHGAVVRWKPVAGPYTVDLTRVTISSPRGATATQTSKTSRTPPKQMQEVQFAASQVPVDAGGTLDPTALRGGTYRYTARRVVTVVLEGHALQLSSALSEPVEVAIRTSFPPAVPSGVASIATGQAGGAPGVDLSWRPNSEADLQGYLVSRQEVTDGGAPLGPPARLTPAPLPDIAFHDAAVAAGHRYRYTVTAVSSGGDESPPSVAAQEDLREP